MIDSLSVICDQLSCLWVINAGWLCGFYLWPIYKIFELIYCVLRSLALAPSSCCSMNSLFISLLSLLVLLFCLIGPSQVIQKLSIWMSMLAMWILILSSLISLILSTRAFISWACYSDTILYLSYPSGYLKFITGRFLLLVSMHGRVTFMLRAR